MRASSGSSTSCNFEFCWIHCLNELTSIARNFRKFTRRIFQCLFVCAHESVHCSLKCYIRRPYSYLLNRSRRETNFLWCQHGFLLLSSLLCSAGAAVRAAAAAEAAWTLDRKPTAAAWPWLTVIPGRFCHLGRDYWPYSWIGRWPYNGTNILFFTMGNHLGLSQGDHNGEVTGLVRWP